jgi:hypothetical protein
MQTRLTTPSNLLLDGRYTYSTHPLTHSLTPVHARTQGMTRVAAWIREDLARTQVLEDLFGIQPLGEQHHRQSCSPLASSSSSHSRTNQWHGGSVGTVGGEEHDASTSEPIVLDVPVEEVSEQQQRLHQASGGVGRSGVGSVRVASLPDCHDYELVVLGHSLVSVSGQAKHQRRPTVCSNCVLLVDVQHWPSGSQRCFGLFRSSL